MRPSAATIHHKTHTGQKGFEGTEFARLLLEGFVRCVRLRGDGPPRAIRTREKIKCNDWDQKHRGFSGQPIDVEGDMAVVRFPEGTIVDAVGIGERDPDKTDRDYGFYLDARWQPTWNADVIEWEDYGLPAYPAATADAICNAFQRARRGERVEVGCVGGLGRTGTVLACMAILAGVAPGQAVEWVRRHYDPAAVETPEQEDWVLWFAEHLGPGTP